MARTGSKRPKPDKAPAAKIRKKISSPVREPFEQLIVPPALTNFSVGDRVTHRFFGDGGVTSICDGKLTINFKKEIGRAHV